MYRSAFPWDTSPSAVMGTLVEMAKEYAMQELMTLRAWYREPTKMVALRRYESLSRLYRSLGVHDIADEYDVGVERLRAELGI